MSDISGYVNRLDRLTPGEWQELAARLRSMEDIVRQARDYARIQGGLLNKNLNADMVDGYHVAASGADAHALLTDASGNITVSGSVIASTAIGCRAKRTTNYTIGNASWTAVPMESTLFEQPSAYDMWTVGSATRLTCKVEGIYIVGASMRWTANATGKRGVAIRKGGSTYQVVNETLSVGASVMAIAVECVMSMAVNEYIEGMTYQNSGGNLDLKIDGDNTSIWMLRIP